MMVYIIGTGVMGSAIAKVLAKKGQRVFVYDKTFGKAKALAKGSKILADVNFANLPRADFVILAVKPYHITEVADDVRGKIKSSATIISIAAGVKIFKIQKLFKHKKVLRMMPNLGLSVGEGISGWKSSALNNREKSGGKKLISLITENFEVKNENQLDAITAISGSGPAYFFLLAEALQSSAESLGLSPQLSRKLVEKTFRGAALLQKGNEYNQLIKKIASKKGITEAALKVFKRKGFGNVVNQAVKAGFKRTLELSLGNNR